MSVALLCGGALLILGAMLPWLTIYAGFQQYNGMIGQFGWAIFGAGVLAMGAGALALRSRSAWLSRVGIALGFSITAFTVWLLQGLDDIVPPGYRDARTSRWPGPVCRIGRCNGDCAGLRPAMRDRRSRSERLSHRLNRFCRHVVLDCIWSCQGT